MSNRPWWAPWLWMSPALVLLAVFLVYPVLDTIRRSFYDERSNNWIGFDNYQFIIENPTPIVADTHSALLNNAVWLVLFTALTVPLGVALAVLSGRVRYEAVAKAAIFVPMAISFVAASVIWSFMLDFDPNVGTVNAVLTGLGGDQTDWLRNTGSPIGWFTDVGPNELPKPIQLNNFALVMVGVWMWTGFALVVLSAGLKGISTELLEAARVDGANEFQIFWKIIIPNLRPVIIVVSTTLIINALKVFDLIWVMTGGSFDTHVVATLFFETRFINQDIGLGSALAVVLLIAIVPLMALGIRRFQLQEETR